MSLTAGTMSRWTSIKNPLECGTGRIPNSFRDYAREANDGPVLCSKRVLLVLSALLAGLDFNFALEIVGDRPETRVPGAIKSLRTRGGFAMSRRINLFLLLGIACLSYPAAETMASIGPPGADSEGIAVDPNDPNTVYLASYGGGVAKTTDGGASWSEANSGITNRSIWAVAIDPADSNTVYAGGAGGIY